MKYSRLSTHFKRNATVSCLGVVDSLGTSLHIGVDAVVVAGGEGVKVVETVNGDSVFGGVVSNGGGVSGDVALGHVVSALSTNKESVAAKDGISSEGGSLQRKRMRTRKQAQGLTDLVHVKSSTGVDARLLVGSIDKSRLVALLRLESRVQVELEALGNLVLDLELRLENVGGGPGLGEGETVLAVGVFGLEVSIDDV